MPIGRYECKNCGTVQEVLASKLEPSIVCQKCGGIAKKMPPSRVAIKFVGGGFYSTDNKSKGGDKGEK